MQDFFVLLQPTHSVRMTSPEVSQDALVRRSGLGLGSEGLCTTPTVDVPKVEVQTRCVQSSRRAVKMFQTINTTVEISLSLSLSLV